MITGLFKDFVIISSIILFHELGHITVALIFKWKIEKVIIFPFGGLTVFNQKINRSSKEEFFIAIAGPIFQIIFFILINNQDSIFTHYHNLILSFNLLPIYPLDGAKILNIIYNKIFPFKKSYLLTFITSIIIIIFMFIMILNKKFNVIFLFSVILLMIKLFKYYDELDIIFNKFIFERYLYKIKYKKKKNINGINLNKMFKGKTHNFIINKTIIKEEEFLNKMFDTN